MKRRNRILLWILGVAAVMTVGAGLLIREQTFLQQLPHGTRKRMPGHWRIPSGLPAEVRQGIEGLYLPGTADREAAAESLGRLGSEAAPAVPFLMALLASEGGEGRVMPTSPPLPIIGRLGGGQNGSQFGNLFGNPDPTWRQWFDEMIDYWTSRHDSDPVAQPASDADEAGTALAHIGPAAFEPLVAALKDPLPQVRTRAAAVLGAMRDVRAAEPLLASAREGSDSAAKDALIAIWRLVIESTLADLDAPDAATRARAEASLQALTRARYADRFPAAEEGRTPDLSPELALIEAALASYESPGREAACEAMLAVRHPRMAPILVSQLGRGLDMARIEIALIAIGKPAVEPVIAALKGPHPDVRASAASILGQIGDARAWGPLVDARNDEDAGVRSCIGAAIERVAAPAKGP